MKSGNDKEGGKNTTTGVELVLTQPNASSTTALSEGNMERGSSEDISNTEAAREALVSLAQGGQSPGVFSRSYAPPMAVERPLPEIDNPSAASYLDLQSGSIEATRTDADFLFGLPRVVDLNFSSTGSSPAAASSALPPRRPGVTPNLENGNGNSLFFYPPVLDDTSSPSVDSTLSSGSRPPPVTPSHMNSDCAILHVLPSKNEELVSGVEDNFALSPRGGRDNWEDPINSSFGRLSRTTSIDTGSSISSRENALAAEPPPASGAAAPSMENARQPAQGMQPLPEEESVVEFAPRKLDGDAKEFSILEDF